MNISTMLIALADAIAPESNQVSYKERACLLIWSELELLESVALARCAATDAERAALARWHEIVDADITNATRVAASCACGAVEVMTFAELRATPWYRCPACRGRNVTFALADGGNLMDGEQPHGRNDNALHSEI